MKKYILLRYLLMLFFSLILNTPLFAEDPFAPGMSPPIHNISTWTHIETNGNKLQNKVVTVYGWLFCKKSSDKYGERLIVLLFKSKESLQAGFIEDSIRIAVTQKTITSYSDGDIEKWERLHMQPAYVTGYYVWDKMNEVNTKAHVLEEPLKFSPPISKLETSFWKQIKTTNMLWNERHDP